jgi:peptidoglycan hydrolase-like protein with peptidoglycan-binding domain
MLAGRGGARYYRTGPGPRWSGADRAATAAFQKAQGWSGRDADGVPGPATWRHLVRGDGTGIAAPAAVRGGVQGPPYPGAARFRPGQSNGDVLRLGRQLAAKGFGRYDGSGPGPGWTEADRRAVEAFQRSQGWSGDEADGHPGPETWRRLFS